MNQEPTVRTVSVRYSMIFLFTTAFLFLFSQILDNLFYDYTVIETEIIFIKKIDQLNQIVIELNEVTETSNSLVQALKDNIKDTIDQISKRINYQFEEDDDYQLRQENAIIKNKLNVASQAFLFNIEEKSGFQQDNVLILSSQNILNEYKQSSQINLYYDMGSNFYDLSQTINLHNYWYQDLLYEFDKLLTIQMIVDGDQLLVVLFDVEKQQYELQILSNLQFKSERTIKNIDYKINELVSISIKKNNIIYSQNIDSKLFHHIHLQSNGNWVYKPINLGNKSNQFQKTIKLFHLNENQIAIISAELRNENYYLIGQLCIYQDNEWIIINKFIDVDITDEIINSGQIDQLNIKIDLLHDFNLEHNIISLCLFKKYLIYIKLKQWMLLYQSDDTIKMTRFIKLYYNDLDNERFKKIQYSHYDEILYILSETYYGKFKMYLVDIKELELMNQIDFLKLRMPYFKPGLVVKDFVIKKNQLQNIVILFLFKNGEVACIQKLHYGEGVMKKTFLIELLDIILTLSFVGFFRFLKRLLQKVYSKLIQFFKRLQ